MSESKIDATLHNVGFIYGRISKVYRNDNGYFTTLRLPPADEFSTAPTVQLLSKSQLGNEGETITKQVILGGYGKKVNPIKSEPFIQVTNTYTVVDR